MALITGLPRPRKNRRGGGKEPEGRTFLGVYGPGFQVLARDEGLGFRKRFLSLQKKEVQSESITARRTMSYTHIVLLRGQG